MIVKLKGKLEKKDPVFVDIDVSGIVYRVNISLNTASKIDSDNVVLHVTKIISESSESFYGFINENEKNLFDSLLKLNGIGGRVAIAVCSTFTPVAFLEVVSDGNDKLLQKVPGIGSKVAKRIILEFTGLALTKDNDVDSLGIDNSDAVTALESLGFKKDSILKAMKGVESRDTSIVIKETLKRLQK